MPPWGAASPWLSCGIRCSYSTSAKGPRAASSASRLAGATDLPDFHSSLFQLRDIRSKRDRLIRRVHTLRRDPAVHLHQPRNRQRIAGRTHHRAYSGLLIEVIQQLPRDATAILTLHVDAERDQVPPVRL